MALLAVLTATSSIRNGQVDATGGMPLNCTGSTSWGLIKSSRGIPLYVYEIKNLESKVIQHYEKSSESTYSKAKSDGKTPLKLLRLFALYENLTRFTQPLATEMTDREHAETPITFSTNIVDVSGVSLRMFWNLKGHMQAASQLATANYPETLDRKNCLQGVSKISPMLTRM